MRTILNMDLSMMKIDFEKIQDLYWKIIPYDYRPGQIWYRFKCWAWKRYSTVKPRYLKHTWCDMDHLMAHTMFEILSTFIEEECSPGHVVWYGEYAHMVEVNGEQVNVRDEMQYLYDWWHKKYNGSYEKETDEIYEHTIDEPFVDDNGHLYMSDHNRALYKKASELEQEYEEQLEENLIRLLKIRPYMWT